MKLEKKHYIIIGIVIAIILVWYFFIRKDKTNIESNYRKTKGGGLFSKSAGGGYCDQGQCKCDRLKSDGSSLYLCSCCPHNVSSKETIDNPESNFKWPRWLKIGGCRACIGSNADGCCGGCVCKDAV